MRVKSEVDTAIAVLIWGSAVVIVLSLILVPSPGRMVTAIIGLPMAAGLAWMYFGTYYELRPDHLYCRSGPFVERIPYDRIRSVAFRNNLLSSMALSSKRIEIRQHGKGYLAGTTLISPIDRESFMRDLVSRCDNLRGS